MEYADFLVESGAKTKVDKLERIQKRAIRCADLGKHMGSDYNDLMELYLVHIMYEGGVHVMQCVHQAMYSDWSAVTTIMRGNKTSVEAQKTSSSIGNVSTC